MPKKLTFNLIFSVFIFICLLLGSKYLLLEKKAVFEKKAELSALKNDLLNLDQIFNDLKQKEKEISLLQKTLPSSYEEVAFAISQTENLALLSRQEMETILDKDAISHNSLKAVKITQNTLGTYADYQNFLSQISRLPYHTSPLNLKINKESDRISTSYSYLLFINYE